ncbi:MAG: hypothetical protein ACK56I_30615, partial [bacterium]
LRVGPAHRLADAAEHRRPAADQLRDPLHQPPRVQPGGPRLRRHLRGRMAAVRRGRPELGKGRARHAAVPQGRRVVRRRAGRFLRRYAAPLPQEDLRDVRRRHRLGQLLPQALLRARRGRRSRLRGRRRRAPAGRQPDGLPQARPAQRRDDARHGPAAVELH